MLKTADFIDNYMNRPTIGKKLEVGLSWIFAKAKLAVSNGQLDTDLDGYTDGILRLNGQIIGITEIKTIVTGKDTLLNRKKILTQIFGYIAEYYGDVEECPYKVLLMETGNYIAYVPFDAVKTIYVKFKSIFDSDTWVSPSKIWNYRPDVRDFMRSSDIEFYSWKVTDIDYKEFINKVIEVCK